MDKFQEEAIKSAANDIDVNDEFMPGEANTTQTNNNTSKQKLQKQSSVAAVLSSGDAAPVNFSSDEDEVVDAVVNRDQP